MAVTLHHHVPCARKTSEYGEVLGRFTLQEQESPGVERAVLVHNSNPVGRTVE